MKPAKTLRARRRLALALMVGAGAGLVLAFAWFVRLADEPDSRARSVLSAHRGDSSRGGPLGDSADAAARQPLQLGDSIKLEAAADSPLDRTGLDDPYFAGVPAEWTTGFRVHGRVVNEFGAPLVDADIVFVPDPATRAVVEEATGRTPGAGPSTRTAPDGSFDLQTRRGLLGAGTRWRQLDASTRAIVVDDPRCTALWHECPESDIAECDVGTLIVLAGAFVRGRVVDGAGRPVGGIHVRLDVDVDDAVAARLGFDEWWGLPLALRDAVTEDDGSYGFRSVWPGEVCAAITSDDWQHAEECIDVLTPGASVEMPDLIAEEGLVVHVIVLDSRQQPVDDATVVAAPLRSSSLRPSTADLLRLPVEDNDYHPRRGSPSGNGRYTIRGLDNTAHVVAALASSGRADPVAGVWPGGVPVVLQLVPLETPGQSPGIVVFVETPDGQPVAAARVQATGESEDEFGDHPCGVRPTAPGAFAVDRRVDRGVSLCVEAPGFATRCINLELLVSEQQAVELQGCSARDTSSSAVLPPHVHVVLAPEARVQGRVVDERGAGMPQVRLRFQLEGMHPDHAIVHEAVTDAAGAFAARGLGAGEWGITPSGDELAEAEETELTLAAGESRADVVLTVQRTGAVEGCIVDVDGSCSPLLHDWTVRLVERAFDDPLKSSRRLPGVDVNLDAGCCFRATGLMPGGWVLRGPRGTRCPVDVVAGEVSSVRLVVPPPPRLRVRVLDGAQPVAGARIHWAHLDDNSQRTGVLPSVKQAGRLPVTDAQGEARLTLDEMGLIVVRALLDGGAASEVGRVDLVPDADILLVLQLGSGRVEGLVLDALSGEPLPGAQVSLSGADAVRTDAQGLFVVPRVGAGTFRWLVSAPGHFPLEPVPVTVAAGQVVSGLRIALPPAACMRITVLGPNGQTAEASTVAWGLNPPPGDDVRVVRHFPRFAGWLSSGNLPPGQYRVAVFSTGDRQSCNTAAALDGLGLAAQVVSLAPGETRDVTLYVAPGP